MASITADEPIRVLLISHFFSPSGETGGNRATALARHLRASGHEVRVLTTAAYGRLPEDGEAGNVRTYDLQLLPARVRGRATAEDAFSSGTYSMKAHPLSRILVPDAHLLAWTPFALVRALRLARTSRFDCVFTTSPPESVHFIGRALARRGIPWIADLRDGWAFEPWNKEQMWPTKAQRRINEWLERRTLSGADAATAVTTTLVEYLSDQLGLRAALLPNGWEPRGTGASDGAEDFRLDRSRISAIYTGRLAGSFRDPAPLIGALRRLAKEDPDSARRLELVFAGSFTEEEQGLFDTDCAPARIVNLGRLDRDRVSALQHAADAGVLINGRGRRYEAGSKLFEYIGARLPVLALATPDCAAAEIVTAAGGMVVDTHDEEAISEGLRMLARGEVARPDRSIADSYAWPAIADRLAEVMRETIARRA